MAHLYSGYRSQDSAAIREIYEPGYTISNEKMVGPLVEERNRQSQMFDFLSDLINSKFTNSILDYGSDKDQHIPSIVRHCQRDVYDISNRNLVDGVIITNDLRTVGSVDFVMASNVLEHLPNPSKALWEIRKVRTVDTLLFIDVPP